MWKSAVLAGLSAAIITAPTGHLFAKSICYQRDDQGNSILRIDVSYHSKLTTYRETRKFGFDAELGRGHPIQKTYSAQGNSVVDDEGAGYLVGTLDGTVTVARGAGARMGLTNAEVNPFVGYQHTEYGCASNEPSPTPATWSCEGLHIIPDSSIGGFSETLTRVDPLSNDTCSRFSIDLD